MAGVRDTLNRLAPQLRGHLAELIAVPSVSVPDPDGRSLHAMAAQLVDLFRAAGMPDARLIDTHGAAPLVVGECQGPPGAPTVLLYAHYDVVGAGDRSQWSSPPFVATEREECLVGRGAADDKAGIIVHEAAIRAFGSKPPVGVKLLLEGEEEVGSPNLATLIAAGQFDVSADVVVIADGANKGPREPGLVLSLRGLVECVLEVRTMEGPLHSGYSGPVPDALMVLVRILAGLHDSEGNVTVPGLVQSPSDIVGYLTEDEFRELARLVPGASLIGSGSFEERLSLRPAVSVVGIDAPKISEASSTLLGTARAKIALRLAPADDPETAAQALAAHIESLTPWGAEVRIVSTTIRAKPFDLHVEPEIDAVATQAFFDAWGAPPVKMRLGASIPVVALLRSMLPAAAFLVTGVADLGCQAHAADEAIVLSDFDSACLAEALLLAYLGDR